MDKLNILTCNVRGLGNHVKRKQIFQYLRNKNIDIAFVQETHGTASSKRIWKSQWGGKAIFANGQGNARGTAILFARKLEIKIVNTWTDDQG